MALLAHGDLEAHARPQLQETGGPLEQRIFLPLGYRSFTINHPGQIMLDPASVNAIEVHDGKLVVAVGPRIQIIDVSNPELPRRIGQSEALPGDIETLHVFDGLALAEVYRQGWHIFDLEDPEQPRLANSLTADRALGYWVHLGDRRFIYESWDFGGPGFHVFDLSDPTRLVRLSSFGRRGARGHPGQLVVHDGRAYVAIVMDIVCGRNVGCDPTDVDLDTWDLRIPLLPRSPQISRMALPESNMRSPFRVADLMLLDYSSSRVGLQALRLSDQPTLLGKVPREGRWRSRAIHGGVLAVLVELPDVEFDERPVVRTYRRTIGSDTPLELVRELPVYDKRYVWGNYDADSAWLRMVDDRLLLFVERSQKPAGVIIRDVSEAFEPAGR